MQTAAVEGESTLVPLRFAVDIRTNSIIASGSAGSLGVVEAILLRMDDSDVRNRKSLVYRLKNSFASDVATAINEFLRSERQVETQTQGLYSAFEQIEREVVVVAEPVSNSLIVSATPRFFDEIEKLIEKLDERPPMVMIQVLIAEVTLNNLDEFGIELGLQDSLLFDRSLLSHPRHHDQDHAAINAQRHHHRHRTDRPGRRQHARLQLQQPAVGQQRQRQVAGHRQQGRLAGIVELRRRAGQQRTWATAAWSSPPPARA